MNQVDRLHNRPNGMWSEAMAEWNKLLFLRAYIRRVDEVAELKALKESQSWIEKESHGFETDEAAPLLLKWLEHPPQTEEEWKWWIAVHQRHLFVPINRRGAFYSRFPAFSKRSRKPNPRLTLLFFEALQKKVSMKTPSS